MIVLKQSTAVDVVLGAFVDDTDGKTAETALTITQADVQITKGGAAAAQKNDATSATHLANGHYKIPLNATDTNTVGHMRIMVNESGALPVWADFQVVEEAVYANMYATSAAGPLTGAQVEAEVTDALNAYDAPTKAELDSGLAALNNVSSADVNAACDTAIADASLATAAALATVDSNVDAILVDTSTTLEGHLTDIKGGTFSGTTDSLEAIRDRGDAAWLTGAGGSAPTAADIRAEIDTNSTQLAAILADTGTSLPATLATILEDTGTTIPGLIAALNDLSAAQVNAEVDTALLDYDGPTKAELDAAIAALNDLSAAQVNAEVDAALADYDGPTKAEMDVAVGAVPTATENADALLNRDMSAVSDTNARTLLNAIRILRNKYSISGSVLTVTKEDDTTSAWTAAITSDSGADPITGSDPT